MQIAAALVAVFGWGCLDLPRTEVGAPGMDAAEAPEMPDFMVEATAPATADVALEVDAERDRGVDAGPDGAADLGRPEAGAADRAVDSAAVPLGPNCPDAGVPAQVAAVCRFMADCAVLHCAYEGEACVTSFVSECISRTLRAGNAGEVAGIACSIMDCPSILDLGGRYSPDLVLACADGADPITCEPMGAEADAGP